MSQFISLLILSANLQFPAMASVSDSHVEKVNSDNDTKQLLERYYNTYQHQVNSNNLTISRESLTVEELLSRYYSNFSKHH